MAPTTLRIFIVMSLEWYTFALFSPEINNLLLYGHRWKRGVLAAVITGFNLGIAHWIGRKV